MKTYLLELRNHTDQANLRLDYFKTEKGYGIACWGECVSSEKLIEEILSLLKKIKECPTE